MGEGNDNLCNIRTTQCKFQIIQCKTTTKETPQCNTTRRDHEGPGMGGFGVGGFVRDSRREQGCISTEGQQTVAVPVCPVPPVPPHPNLLPAPLGHGRLCQLLCLPLHLFCFAYRGCDRDENLSSAVQTRLKTSPGAGTSPLPHSNAPEGVLIN